jgi:dolichyl-phosphate beta-glucosyltransferase
MTDRGPTDRGPSLSIIVPAYQEESRIRRSLGTLAGFLRARGETFEVLVVDDGSRDATAALVEEFARAHDGFSLVRLPANRGKGAAVREGMARSRGERVVFSDADLSTPLEELDALDRALADGADFALASRGLRESRLEVHQPWYREHMGKLFNGFVRLLTGIPFRDTQCGFKLLRGDAARALAARMREDRFAFDVELILLARRRGLALREIPVTWRNDAGSRVNPVRDSAQMLLALARIVARTGRYR